MGILLQDYQTVQHTLWPTCYCRHKKHYQASVEGTPVITVSYTHTLQDIVLCSHTSGSHLTAAHQKEEQLLLKSCASLVLSINQ